MFNKILVPIDGSELSYKALTHGAEIAEKFGAHLSVFHVMPLTSKTIGFEPTMTLIDTIMQELKVKGEEYIDKAEQILKNFPIKYDTEITSGIPTEEINKKAAAGYDLIVLGSRGMGEFKGLLLGSVSNKISHLAKQPVLIVH